ncbi:hypothetical protein EZS27_018643 [termite gut metagenome]|uniref:Uncharacterized protein n=1 Tax=termite gut metagenome TaxID=433724 RepID=A0A5J4RFT9_9ZZZZ
MGINQNGRQTKVAMKKFMYHTIMFEIMVQNYSVCGQKKWRESGKSWTICGNLYETA